MRKMEKEPETASNYTRAEMRKIVFRIFLNISSHSRQFAILHCNIIIKNPHIIQFTHLLDSRSAAVVSNTNLFSRTSPFTRNPNRFSIEEKTPSIHSLPFIEQSIHAIINSPDISLNSSLFQSFLEPIVVSKLLRFSCSSMRARV